MTNPTHRLSPITFQVKARMRVKWPSQGLGDMRSHGLHVIIPPHKTLLQPPHWSAPTTPDPAPCTPLGPVECPHELPSQNAPQRPWPTWPLPEITWASCDNHVTTCHLVSGPLSQQPCDLRVPT